MEREISVRPKFYETRMSLIVILGMSLEVAVAS